MVSDIDALSSSSDEVIDEFVQRLYRLPILLYMIYGEFLS